MATFDLPCSRNRGILDLGYLVSYDGMGAVKVVLEGSPEALDVDVRREDDLNGAGEELNVGLDIAQHEEGVSPDAVIDAMWGTIVSIVTYRTMAIPEGIKNDIIRVTFEILSEEGEIEHDTEMNPSGKGRNRADRKFKLVSMQCC